MTRYIDCEQCGESHHDSTAWCQKSDDYDPSFYCDPCQAINQNECDCRPRAEND